ncbi:MAG TPA: hypothetical protein VL418_07550 [Devosiaceae bacterium]|jgi:hypothetical protein|nr:hypothetical protein [Devosiaceae bacterium]
MKMNRLVAVVITAGALGIAAPVFAQDTSAGGSNGGSSSQGNGSSGGNGQNSLSGNHNPIGSAGNNPNVTDCTDAMTRANNPTLCAGQPGLPPQ